VAYEYTGDRGRFAAFLFRTAWTRGFPMTHSCDAAGHRLRARLPLQPARGRPDSGVAWCALAPRGVKHLAVHCVWHVPALRSAYSQQPVRAPANVYPGCTATTMTRR